MTVAGQPISVLEPLMVSAAMSVVTILVHVMALIGAACLLRRKFRHGLADIRFLRDVLRPIAERKVYNLVQLIYRSRQYESGSKDYEFLRSSMEEHLRAGYNDTARTLRHPEVL